MITTGQWPDVYGNLMVDWGDEYSTLEPVGMQLLKHRASTRKTGKASSASFFNLAPDKTEGGAFPEEDPQQDYGITWTQAAVGTSITLTHEDFLYDQTMDMADKVRGLAQSVRLRYEHDIAMRLRSASATTFNNPSGNSVNIACADTLSLINTAHTIPNQTVTNSNDMGAINFNKPNFVKALNRFRQFKNAKGLKINGLRPNALIISDDEEMYDLAQRVLKSDRDPGSAQNDQNPLNTRGIQIIRIPGLQQDGSGAFDTTGRYYWFAADLVRTDYFMVEAETPNPVFPNFQALFPDPNMQITGDHKVTVRGSYALYIRRPIWIVGSLATNFG